ncbi:MAG: V-type ATPase subunit [Thermoplasmata archaeon]|nr:V-type ATPase subunit [Thermoplasmata archaeon]
MEMIEIFEIGIPFITSKFSYSNAKFSAIPNTFIKEKEISRLLESGSIEDFKNNVVSRDFILKGENADELQKSIDESLIKIIKMARDDSPKKVKEFYNAYIKKIDSYTIKNAVRAIIEGKEIENNAFLEKTKEMINKIKMAEKEEINLIFKEYGWNIDINKPIEEVERDIEKQAVKFLIEVKLPSSCIKARDRFAKTLIDLLNLKAILRGKYYDLPIYLYGEGWELPIWKLQELMKIDSISEIVSILEGTSYFSCLRNAIADFEREGVIAFERALDKHLLKVSREIANENPLALGPGIRFIFEKEMEARNLKIVAKAIEENMPSLAMQLVVVE